MEKQAYIVTAPESCGNHLMMNIFVGMGCYYGGSVMQLPSNGKNPWVIACPIPKGKVWADPLIVKERLESMDYSVKTIIGLRDWYPAIRSKINRKLRHDNLNKLKNIQEESSYLFEKLVDLKPYHFFNMSLLITDFEMMIRNLEKFIGLKYERKNKTSIRFDVDEKWKTNG